MEILIYFAIAFFLSAIGSVPVGMITITIAQATIEKGTRSGIMIALGASIMEFVYTYIALISLDLFAENSSVGQYIKVFATIVFFGMAIYYLTKEHKEEIQAASTYDYFDFLNGFLVALFNVLIIPFWVFIAIWLQSYGYRFEQTNLLLSFSLGSTLGALLIFIAYVFMGDLIISKFKKINRYTNKIIGLVFLGLAIFQLVQFVV